MPTPTEVSTIPQLSALPMCRIPCTHLYDNHIIIEFYTFNQRPEFSVVNIRDVAHGSNSQANVDSASMNGPLMLA